MLSTGKCWRRGNKKIFFECGKSINVHNDYDAVVKKEM